MRWTTEQDAAIRSMYETHTRKEIAAMLDLTEGQVRSRFWTLGMSSKIRPWTDCEVEILKSTYKKSTLNPDIGLDSLAKTLNRNKTNVCRKARSLGLTDISRRRVVERKNDHRMFANKEEAIKHVSDLLRKWRNDNPHPKGMSGKKHTKGALNLIKAASKRSWDNPMSKLNSAEHRQKLSDNLIRRIANREMRSGYTRCAGGRRADLGGIYFRSAWEANYARFLNWLKEHGDISMWEYEVHTFVFEKIKRGTRAYTPDFKVTYPSGKYEWHEVKGWMDPKSKTRLKRMEKYFPEEKVMVIDEKWFRSAYSQGITALIPGWEKRGRGNRGC